MVDDSSYDSWDGAHQIPFQLLSSGVITAALPLKLGSVLQNPTVQTCCILFFMRHSPSPAFGTHPDSCYTCPPAHQPCLNCTTNQLKAFFWGNSDLRSEALDIETNSCEFHMTTLLSTNHFFPSSSGWDLANTTPQRLSRLPSWQLCAPL